MKIAITGGIGAGKSYVCQRLSARGSAVYDCDSAAKRLMAESQAIREGLISLVGPGVYSQGQLRKDVLTEFLLQSEANKQAVNDVVHPAVAEDFMASGYDWLESAILFDSGFDRRIAFDHVICVTAPEPLRVERIMARDHVSRDRALEWIRRQMPQQRMVELSHYVIVNDGVQDIDIQISQINNNINRL